MQVTLKNVGPIRTATFDVADLTVICGESNTGKTDATYALCGFLANWRGIAAAFPELILPLEDFIVANGQVDLEPLLPQVNQMLAKLAAQYVRATATTASAANYGLFGHSQFAIAIPVDQHTVSKARAKALERTVSISVGRGPNAGPVAATVAKAAGSLAVNTSRADAEMPLAVLHKYVVGAIAGILIQPHLPDAFIASAERARGTLLGRDLDFARAGALEAIGMANPRDLKDKLFQLLLEAALTGYRQTVADNPEFSHNLEVIDKDVGPVVAAQPQVLDRLVHLIAGEFKEARESPGFAPGDATAKLKLAEEHRSVRALLEVGFYLRHTAEPGDLLMIDETGLNLHPENQRLLAKLLAALVAAGVRVFLTTNTELVIGELNTLITVRCKDRHDDAVAAECGCATHDRLDAAQVRVYTTARTAGDGDIVLTAAPISPTQGIELGILGQAIGARNRTQVSRMQGAVS